LQNQFDARAVDIKSMKAALKNRDTQLHQLTLKLREAEESLQRCNETAAEELTALTGEARLRASAPLCRGTAAYYVFPCMCAFFLSVGRLFLNLSP
jgi:hypothetical protein